VLKSATQQKLNREYKDGTIKILSKPPESNQEYEENIIAYIIDNIISPDVRIAYCRW